MPLLADGEIAVLPRLRKMDLLLLPGDELSTTALALLLTTPLNAVVASTPPLVVATGCTRVWHHMGVTIELQPSPPVADGGSGGSSGGGMVGRARQLVEVLYTGRDGRGSLMARVRALDADDAVPRAPRDITGWYAPPLLWRSHDPTALCRAVWRGAVALGGVTDALLARATELERCGGEAWHAAVGSDASAFSFWVMGKVPFDWPARLLRTPGSVYRLRALASMLPLAHSLDCDTCGCTMALPANVPRQRMPDGVGEVVVNPAGYAFRLIALTGPLLNVSSERSGRPTTESTWFPGFAWSLAYCGWCNAHCGWRFDWVGDGSALVSRSLRYACVRVTAPRRDAAWDRTLAEDGEVLAVPQRREDGAGAGDPGAEEGSENNGKGSRWLAELVPPPPHGMPRTFWGMQPSAVRYTWFNVVEEPPWG